MEGRHEKDVTVSIDQVPAAVKATIEKEANGAKTEEIEKKLKDGKEVYSVDIVAGGKKTEVKMDANGKVIAREADAEKKEGGHADKKEKKDKEEHED
jgi:hypothetical protein